MMMEEEIVDSSDDDSASSNDEKDQELEKRSEEIESQLSNNNYQYDLHVELVEIYEKLTDFNSLRVAYERFHQVYPLTPKLWLSWIRNEMKVATSDEEKKAVRELFEKAVEDYLSVNLWLEYAQFVMETGTMDDTKGVLEKALNSAGIHTSDGSLLWDFFREIELANLSIAAEGSDAWKEQVGKVVDIFRRQLSVPLLGMERTYEEWKVWQETLPETFILDPKPTEWGYQKALKLLETYKPFEDELLASGSETEILEVFKKYISAVKDPSTVICLYERAVCQLCLNPNLWLDYCNYTFKLGDVGLKTSIRSLRNCPWSEELWCFKLKVLENLNKGEEVLGSFEQGLQSLAPSPGIQLWFSYVEFLVRNCKDDGKLDKVLVKACEQAGEFDTTSSLQRFHARLLAKRGEMKEAVGVWNRVVNKQENKGNLTIWLEFISLVKQFGDLNQTRSLYQRALNTCKEWAYYIAEEWLIFEREHGTLLTVMKCQEKCKSVSSTLQQNPVQFNEQSRENPETLPRDKPKKRKFEQEVKVEVKRIKKEVEKLTIEPKKPIDKDPTKTVFISNIGPKVDEETLEKMFPNAENLELCRDRKGKSKCFAYVQFKMEEEVMSALARDRELLDGRPVFISNCKPDKKERKPVFKYSSELEQNKLFVRGLPKTYNKEEVAKIFEPYGASDTRIVLHKSGQPKGLAYIEFPDAESTKKALQGTDQMKIGEHVISVALSAPPPKKASDEKVLEPTRHARSRLQLPFIPRAVKVKGEKVSDNGQQSTGQKSNDDFRKLLLNK